MCHSQCQALWLTVLMYTYVLCVPWQICHEAHNQMPNTRIVNLSCNKELSQVPTVHKQVSHIQVPKVVGELHSLSAKTLGC